MSTVAYAFDDSRTMLRRSLRRLVRYPSMTIMLVGMPVVFLLMFVYVFGGTLGTGIAGLTGIAGVASGHGGRAGYADYVTPGIILITVASAVQGTAISVALDMSSGIIARLRTMPITRTAVLTGHVVTSVLQTLASIVVVVAVALAVGFRPSAGVLGWVAAAGVLVLFTLALIWLAVALGLAAKSPETASNTPMFLVLLPFLSSGFVPTGSMPAALRWFAQYQPFTPLVETLRALLLGAPMGGSAVAAVAWSTGILVLSYIWAKRLFGRHPARTS